MKHITTIIFLCMFSSITYAQKVVEKHINYSSSEKITLNIQIADSIRIITWNKNEVYVKASIDINDNKDNDVYLTSFNESGNTIDIKAKFDEDKSKRMTDSYNDSCRCCCNYKSKIYWDVYIPESSAFSVETISGNIAIQGKTGEINANSISGFIDLAFASSRKANLRMSTITGTIYTDLAIGKTQNRYSDNTIYSEYNGGGEKVYLKTISGNIFLRKTP